MVFNVVLLLYVVGIVCICREVNGKEELKGAVIALTKFWRVDKLIIRNKYIETNLFNNRTMDIIVFHQNDIDDDQKAKIQTGTPDMPIKFVNVDKFFRRTQKPALTTNNALCPSNKMSSMTPPGYKTMCAFFAYKFREYLPKGSYEWMLRVDDDCYIRSKVKKRFPPRPLPDGSIPHVMSPNWIIDAGGPDSLRDERPGTDAGLLTHGLRRMAYEFAKEKNITRTENARLFPSSPADMYISKLTGNGSEFYSIYDLPHDSLYEPKKMSKVWGLVEKYKDRKVWPAPATNTFYLNLTWLYSQPTVLSWMNRVEHSKCVFSNRWGDLPIWGSTLALTNETIYRWDINVEHTSHRCVYMSRKQPLKLPNVAPCNDVHVDEIVDYF